METLLRGIPGIVLYFDDIIFAGASHEELSHCLRDLLSRFQEVGLRLNKDKCNFGVDLVEFLGFLIDAKGFHPMSNNTQAIINVPRPTNKAVLQAFLGLVNYHVFLRHKATIRLLDKHTTWVWGRVQQSALILACDASPYGS